MTDGGALRMRVFAFVALVLFSGLVARLWYLQGLESQREELQQQAQTNVLERVFEEGEFKIRQQFCVVFPFSIKEDDHLWLQ